MSEGRTIETGPPLRHRRLYPSQPLHGQLAHSIGHDIVDGLIGEGALLPREAELAQQFKVSRQAVREALKVLGAKGLVSSRRRTGTIVLPRDQWNLLDPDVIAWHRPERIPVDFLNDLVELRALIEPVAAEAAAGNASRVEIAAIATALDRMRVSFGDVPAFAAADVEFHLAVAQASGNALFERLIAIFQPLLNVSLSLQKAVPDSVPLHAAIYDAIAKGDGAGARQAMERLLRVAAEAVSAIPRDGTARRRRNAAASA